MMKNEWRKARKKQVIVQFREVQGEQETIKTREGTVITIDKNHFVMKGVEGEIYPITKDIFYKTYEELSDETPHPKCLKCGNHKEFEIEKSDWAQDEEGNHMLVEKVKCAKCGAKMTATYKLERWEKCSDE